MLPESVDHWWSKYYNYQGFISNNALSVSKAVIILKNRPDRWEMADHIYKQAQIYPWYFK